MRFYQQIEKTLLCKHKDLSARMQSSVCAHTSCLHRRSLASAWAPPVCANTRLHLCGYNPRMLTQPFLLTPTSIVFGWLRELISRHPMLHASPIFETPSCLHLPPMSPQTRNSIHVDGGGGPQHEVRSLNLKRMEGAWAHL